MVIILGSWEKIHIKIVDAHFIIGGHQFGQALGQVINIIIAQVKRTADIINDCGNVAGHPQRCIHRKPVGAADFPQEAFPVGLFSLHQIVPVIGSLLFHIIFSIVEFFVQKIGRIGRSKYLQMGVN